MYEVKHQRLCCRYTLYLNQYHQHHLQHKHLLQHRCQLLILIDQSNQQHQHQKHQDYLMYEVKYQQHCRRYMLYLIQYHRHHLRAKHLLQHSYLILLLIDQSNQQHLYHKDQDYLKCVIKHQRLCCRYTLYLNQYHQHHLRTQHLLQYRCLILLLMYQSDHQHQYHKQQDYLMCVIKHQQNCCKYRLYLIEDHQHHLQLQHLLQYRYLILLLIDQSNQQHLYQKDQDYLKCALMLCLKHNLDMLQHH